MTAPTLLAALLGATAVAAALPPRPRLRPRAVDRPMPGPLRQRGGSRARRLRWPGRVVEVDRERSLPLVLDLLAGCLAAGASPALAVATVAGVARGELREELTAVAGELALGAPAAAAWRSWLRRGGASARAAAAFGRAERAGADLAPELAALADDVREALRTRAQIRAQRAGVLAVAPLGLCFLPAFLLLAVVPVVAGLVRVAVPTP